ncbi:DUF5718 family protein [Helicobacter sp. 11S02629-2]|uniref:DUF5718 family protein n=1 Tax=Helicobacter sp. 11S02629-2 TaxID=1476195 RepID=UPI000BA586CA|nr:DUF5718 family protein [Helicobacter sp. 11S02629-2]PAF42905.1 hypothetical protein BKH40_07475 [Helicobacter sp. 11S02629-2]
MKQYMCFGVAGNFAGHLEQAGEASDFHNVKADEEGAPKGIFPFYIPGSKDFLGRYCIDNQKVVLPEDPKAEVQAEPEIALECEVVYEDGKIKTLVPKYFMAFDDTSVRNDKNATKISQKKNFSIASKGMGNKKIKIDKFSKGGICDNYSITAFLISDGVVHQYGENSEIASYSYFYEKLIDWIVKKLNTQQDFSVLENLSEIIKNASCPKHIVVAIGATRYTHLGETRFLKDGDEICIITYDHTKNSFEDIKNKIKDPNFDLEGASIVRQKILKA